MVFESLIVDLLNRFLGPYVENLNKNSLKLGIWSGDAVLENLCIKDGALDELELPFQIKAGSLEKLTLKIPWKNLYTSQVVAKIDGLYLLIVPKQGSYDAEKDKKNRHDAKQKALEKVEQAKEQENKTQESDNKSDTFAEKMATQIIKNLQVEIQNIHIRYEDNVTNPKSPFSAGVSLHNLSFETTNEDWRPCILEQAVKMVYKLVKLDCLALYLNSNTRLFGSMSKDQCLVSLKSSIASPGHVDPDFQYVIEPISSEAQLKINPKPGNDLSNPKAWMNLVVMSIDLTLRQQQYQNLLQLLDSFERMVRNEPYMKYRPKAICHGNAKLWWKYAQTSILEENVRRKHKMWAWEHIKAHRDLSRKYIEVYGKKLATSKPSKELLSQLESFEDELDVFNLTLCRQQAELQYRRKKKKKEKEKKNAGWFGGFFGGGKKEKDDSLELSEVAERVQNAMTAEDKSKLYEAIGYTEEIPDTAFPKEYIGILLNFHLIQTSVKLVDDTTAAQSNVLGVQISDLKAGISQRPAADAIRLDAKLNTFNVFGTSVGCEQHQMVESQNLEEDMQVDLLEVEFETNPLDGLVDQRVKVLTRPLKIVYDSNTINQIVKFFEPPQDVHLDELSAAAASTIDDFTEQSATSLQYMADTKKILDVTVDLKPSYIIIPENGVYSENGKVLVADLGHFRMTTEHEEKYDAPRKENESLEELMKKSYDRFNMDLKSVQIILANEGEDWEAARKKVQSPLHLLQPLNVEIALHKCLVEDNRMPKVRILGELPSLDIDFSDKKLKDLISLATSIPLPETKPAELKQQSKASFSPSASFQMPLLSDNGVNYNINLAPDDDDDSDVEQDGYFTPCGDHSLSDKSEGLVEKLTNTRDVIMFDSKKFNISKTSVAVVPDDDDDEDEFMSAEEGDEEDARQPKSKLKRELSLGSQPRSNLELDFEVKRIALNMCKNNGSIDEPLLAVNIVSLGAKVELKPWQVTLDASLGSVSVQHMQMKALDGGDLYLVRTPLQDTTGERLMHLNYQKIEKDNPDFHTTYNSTEQNIQVDVAGLSLIAHAEAILNIVAFSEQIVAMLDESKEEDKALDEGYSSDSDKKPVRRRQTRPLPTKVIDVQLMAKLGVISIEACTCDAALARVDVRGVEAGVTVQKHQTIVSASLKDVTVVDPSPNTLYPKILSIVESSEVFKLGVVVHNSATVGQHYKDMSAVDLSLALSVGRIRAVFVNKFIMDLLQFVNRFSAAKAAAIEASENAAASAAKTMQEMQAQAMRALLDVNIKAPVVIIPRSSTSRMAIYADLGQMYVKNTFRIAAGSEGLAIPAVVDIMDIGLNNVKLSRALIENGEVIAECQMLEPANMQLEIHRNLAAAYFTKLPAIAITGKLQAVNMHVGPDDIGLAFGVLNENLTEGQERPDDIAEPEDLNKDKQKDKGGDSEGADQKQVSSQLSLNFAIESAGISMYQKSVDLTSCTGVQNAEEGLGRLTVHGLEVEADMLTDSSVSAHMHLVDCILDDIRPERVDGVTRMFGRQAKTDGDSQMLVVKVDQRSNGSILIVIAFNDVQTCVCVEFLMTVSQIFLKGLEKGQSTDINIRKTESVPDSSQSASPTTLDLSLHLKVENPEIILVADSSRTDTNCLVMTSIGDMRLRMNADLMSISGGFSQVSINACPYLVENRKGKLRKVLIPCNMGFQLQAPTGEAHHINVSFQEVLVNISPETVAILAAAAQGLTPPQVEEEQHVEVSKDLWNVAKVKDQNFWFLREDIETDVDLLPLKSPSDLLVLPESSRGEELIFTVEMFAMKIETLCGSKMVPMLSAEAKVDAIVKDWSTRMKMESTITFEMSSYNEKTACWDPLLEPLEKQSGGHRPWNLNIFMVKNDDISDTSSSTGTSTTSSEDESIELAPPLMSITVSSNDVMQLTVTKSCLTMLLKLSEIFSEALAKGHSEIQLKTKEAACTITNSIGVSIYIKPGKYFEIPNYAKDGKIRLQPGEVLTLDMSRELSRRTPIKLQSLARTSDSNQQSIDFQVEGFKEVCSVVLSRVGHILYNLKPTTKQKADMLLSVALEIEAQMDNRFIVIRSPLQMFNHFSIPIEVFINENNSWRNIGVIEPGKRFPVPLFVAHTQDLYVKPKGEYKLCTKPLAWKDLVSLKKQGKKYVSFSCDWKQEGFTPFCFNAITEMDKLRYVKGSSIQSPKYIIHLHPPVMLRNLLPYPIYYTLAGTETEVCVEKAGQASLLHVVMGKTMMWMTIKNYMNMDWNGEMTMRETLKTPLSQWGFRGARQGQENIWLEVGVWADYSSGYLDMAIYSPYWLVNKTEQTLKYRLPLLMKGSGDEVIEHAADTKEPILFSYPTKKSTPGKNKITMQICDSDWSDKFSLDTVGSSGFITCSGKGQNYNIGVKNQFSNFGLTKIIVFTPEYLLVNHSEHDITCMEAGGSDSLQYDVPTGQCIPFWPVDHANQRKLKVKLKGHKQFSEPFLYTDPHTTVLKMDQEVGGITAETQLTETAKVVAIHGFKQGNFTVKLVNTTDYEVKYNQQGVTDVSSLGPNECILYTWQVPTRDRQLVLKVADKTIKNDLVKDGIGDIKITTKKKEKVYWVSFLDGRQRILLFTQDLVIATKAQQAGELEQANLELILSLEGVGLSMVNNYTRTEVAYIGLTSSGIIWQAKQKRRFRDMAGGQVEQLEAEYQKYELEQQHNKNAPPAVYKAGNMEIDFENFVMYNPKRHHIKRTHHPGVWAQLRTSPHQFQFHLKTHRIQMDNQTKTPIFPTVLAPVPPPKSVVTESALKPMIEMSLLMGYAEHSNVQQIKIFQVLIQEMHVKLDQGFLSNFIHYLQPEHEIEGKEAELLEEDIEVFTSPLIKAEAVQAALSMDRNYYDNFHLSPLKIHVSFSLADTGAEAGADDGGFQTRKKPGMKLGKNAVNLLLQSVGVTLTNVDDVIFRLGFFERRCKFYSQPQLTLELTKHYSNQAVKQLYVLVLGLDVIGNPFGFVQGMGAGIKDLFYEPYQGAVQGPEEFAEGVALGMRSLFGHAVGGAAGAVSRITGTLGKGLAALTMDDDYKRKRQQAINRQPKSVQEGFARGGKGLVMGFVEGVSGVVIKPVQGAKKEGAKGFFKGMGKGLAGIVAKPTGGVVDFASSTFEGIRRATEVSTEVKKLRPARFLHPDNVVRPYVLYEATGNTLLQDIDKGKFALTDDYVDHLLVMKDCVMILTDRRIIYIVKQDVLGGWNVAWHHTWKDLKEPPVFMEKGIQVIPKEQEQPVKRGPLGRPLKLANFMKGKGPQGKVVLIAEKDRDRGRRFAARMQETYAKALKIIQ